jgi:hypothetical protein
MRDERQPTGKEMPEATQATAEFDPLDDAEFPDEMPHRPRQRLLTIWSALLVAVLVGAVGFYVGIRVEKSKNAGSSSSLASAFAGHSSAFGGAGSSGSASLRSRFAAAGGFPRAGGSSNDAVGSVSSRDGNTLYVSETGGNTVKVKLSKSTTITKSESVSSGKIFPGDEVTITGAKTSGGGLTAITVSDLGTSSSGSGGSSGSSGSSGSGSGSSSAAVSSLFGG